MKNADDVLSAKNPRWKSEARRLMENKKSFVLVEWGFSFDDSDCKALAQEFDYAYSFDNERAHDANAGRAFFKPKNSN